MTLVEALIGPGTLFQGRFSIERSLGRGGMGEVWAALDTRLERPVAIKMIHHALAEDARYAERFLREMRLVARVAHPGIVRLYDAGTAADGRLFMVMERIFGVPLRQMIAGGTRLDPVRAIHLAIQVADALRAAHEAELVHRDVKPENILVSDGVHARLLDFGVAKDGRGGGLTRQGVAVGTSRYMAPEQITGSADARADLYALGVVLYEMLAGAHPYAVLDTASGIGETEILAAHVHLEARPLPEVLPECPDALWQVVARCLEKRPEARFPRATELAEALREAARASMPPEHAGVRQILGEAADAARARAVRASVSGGDMGTDRLQSTALLPAGFVPPSPAGPGAKASSTLGVAQVFELGRVLGGTEGGAETKAGTGAGTGTGAGMGAGAGAGAVVDARGAAGASAGPATATAGGLASTERWDGAAAVSARGMPLASTAPWDAATGAKVPAVPPAPPRGRWWLVAVASLVLGLMIAAATLGIAVFARG